MAGIDTIFSGLAALGGIGAAVAAVYSYKAATKANETSQRALAFGTISELQREYATDDMFNSLSLLHTFKRSIEHGDMHTMYFHWLKSNVKTNGAPYESARRRVSLYFQRMATIREAQIVPDDTLFQGWSKQDFAILESVIIPMETALAEFLKGEASETVQRLRTLQKAGEDSAARRQPKKGQPVSSSSEVS